MAYKFRPDEPVRDGILRCSREQLDHAVSELSEGISDDPVKAVHKARKAIKKERSLLRLARPTMTSGQRRRENDALREAARALSATRDADVMLASVDALSERFAGQLPASTFDAIRTRLKKRPGDANQDGLDRHALPELGAVRLRADDWRLRQGGWKALEGGLVRTYKRGRGAAKVARASRRSEDLHEWRKRVKDLWYHERLLAPTCGPALRGQAKELGHLSDLLGDEHDLAVLRQQLTDEVSAVPVDLDAVLKLIDHRRDELQTEAIRIGRRVYAESPKAFRRRLKRSWKAGRSLARGPQEQHPAELAAVTREPRSV
jgi:CHAD domain-containing protein